MNVVMTCSPVSSQKARSACDARWRTTPLPTSSTGVAAACSSSTARSRLTGSASASVSGPGGMGRPTTLRAHDVGRELEVRRPRLLRGGGAERLAHGLADHARVVDARVPLGHGPQHVDGVDELVGLLVHADEVDLPGERHERRVVEVGVADAGRQVGGARPEGREADAGVAGEATVGVGHERGALLVARRDERDALGAVEGLVEVEGLLAGDAEDVLDALALETLDEELRGEARRVVRGHAGEDGFRPATHDSCECTRALSPES